MNTEQNAAPAEGGKVKKNFDANLKKLVAIVGGEKKLFPSKKVSTDALTVIVAGLVKDEKEAAEKDIKEKLQNLLRGYTQLRTDIAAKQKELADLEEKKMKEFNESARGLFDRVEKLDDLEQKYYTALSAGTAAVQGAEETDAPTA